MKATRILCLVYLVVAAAIAGYMANDMLPVRLTPERAGIDVGVFFFAAIAMSVGIGFVAGLEHSEDNE